VVEEEKDVRRAMEFLHECDILKIEDILPFFPDFVTIDHFKVGIYYDSNYSISIFSSPEHKVLRVSYCDRSLSVVRRRASSVVRRASSVNFFT